MKQPAQSNHTEVFVLLLFYLFISMKYTSNITTLIFKFIEHDAFKDF